MKEILPLQFIHHTQKNGFFFASFFGHPFEFSLTSNGRNFFPVSKDPSTLQYVVHLFQKTPNIPIALTLDLGGQSLWVNCEDYASSTYRPAPCRSAPCSLAKSSSCTTACYSAPRPGCYNNTCGLIPDNTITGTATSGDLGSDAVSLQSTDGKNPGQVVSVPNFLFVCGTTSLLQGLASGVTGMAGLGRTQISLPSQFSSVFSFHRKFAICLTSSTGGYDGVVFFGDGPYSFLPDFTFTSFFLYIPLIRNPVSTASAFFQGDPSSDYFIGVTSIKINGNVIPINKTLLSINKEGYGGTKISTVNPYTVLETSIYKAVVNAFVHELSKVPRVRTIAPFGACFPIKDIHGSRLGAVVPQIDLVLQSGGPVWTIYGANSMVDVNDDVVCLGFVDRGVNPRTSIVIGGYQIEDNLLQFDLAASRLGFSSTLLGHRTTCANFNFTSIA